jgi:hypothetical protein
LAAKLSADKWTTTHVAAVVAALNKQSAAGPTYLCSALGRTCSKLTKRSLRLLRLGE